MRTLGLGMVAVFGPVFFALVFYLLVDRLRTGELFRQRKVKYAAFGAGVLAVVGVMILSTD
ncbi:hypothetical protein [Arthrobacter sp. Z4-13]